VRLLDRKRGGSGKIAVADSGRPYFADGHADFSVSHSGRTVAAAYSRARSAQTGRLLRVGCDIEYIRPGKSREEIAERFFAPPERAYIRGASPETERLARFYRVWVLKECYLKIFGWSIFAISRVPAFSDGYRLAASSETARFYPFELETPSGDRYSLAVGIENG
jgi:phosphopantetheinyl transferase